MATDRLHPLQGRISALLFLAGVLAAFFGAYQLVEQSFLEPHLEFTVYLTAAAWAPAGESGPVLLDSLRARIATSVAGRPHENDLRLQNASHKKGAER